MQIDVTDDNIGAEVYPDFHRHMAPLGDTPLSEPLLTRFTDAYMRH